MRFLAALLLLLLLTTPASAAFTAYETLALSYGASNIYPLSANPNDAVGSLNGSCAGSTATCAYGTTVTPYVSAYTPASQSIFATPDSYMVSTQTWTEAVWFTSSTLVSGETDVQAFYSNSGATIIFYTSWCPLHTLAIGINNAGSFVGVCSSASLDNGLPHFVVNSCTAAGSGGSCVAYVDGALVGSYTATFGYGNVTGGYTWGANRNLGPSTVLPGVVGEPIVFQNVQLTSGEVSNLYNCGLSNLDCGPTVYTNQCSSTFGGFLVFCDSFDLVSAGYYNEAPLPSPNWTNSGGITFTAAVPSAVEYETAPFAAAVGRNGLSSKAARSPPYHVSQGYLDFWFWATDPNCAGSQDCEWSDTGLSILQSAEFNATPGFFVGQYALTTLVSGGSGYTPGGPYSLIYSGGGATCNPAGTFDVSAGGAVNFVNSNNTQGCNAQPTISFCTTALVGGSCTSPGSGASATAKFTLLGTAAICPIYGLGSVDTTNFYFVSAGSWHHATLQFKFTTASNGYEILKVDGSTLVNFSGATSSSAGEYIGTLMLNAQGVGGSPYAELFFDDLGLYGAGAARLINLE